MDLSFLQNPHILAGLTALVKAFSAPGVTQDLSVTSTSEATERDDVTQPAVQDSVMQPAVQDSVMQPAVQDSVTQPAVQDNSKGTKTKKTDANQFKLEHIVAKAKNGHAVEKIVKPDGSGGRDFHVRDSIGLSHDATWYSDILRSVHFWTNKFLDARYSTAKQDKHTMLLVETEVLKEHPELIHFQGNWPIGSLVQQYLKNSSEQARATTAHTHGLNISNKGQINAAIHVPAIASSKTNPSSAVSSTTKQVTQSQAACVNSKADTSVSKQVTVVTQAFAPGSQTQPTIIAGNISEDEADALFEHPASGPSNKDKGKRALNSAGPKRKRSANDSTPSAPAPKKYKSALGLERAKKHNTAVPASIGPSMRVRSTRSAAKAVVLEVTEDRDDGNEKDDEYVGGNNKDNDDNDDTDDTDDED